MKTNPETSKEPKPVREEKSPEKPDTERRQETGTTERSGRLKI